MSREPGNPTEALLAAQRPDDLAARLVALGWKATLRRVGTSFFFGVAVRT